MWIASKYGFFSIVCAYAEETPPVGKPKAHPTLMMVRARTLAHLKSLIAADIGISGRILHNVATDYPYRVLVERSGVVRAMAAMTEEIDYVNFKDSIHVARPKDSVYHEFLMRTWENGLYLAGPARATGPVRRRKPWQGGQTM